MANEDPEYLRWVRAQRCCMCKQWPSEPHHRPSGTMGARSHDHEAIALCALCHREMHDHQGAGKGPFGHMTRTDYHHWHSERVQEARVKWDRDHAPPVIPF
jgi:hypothetical protein